MGHFYCILAILFGFIWNSVLMDDIYFDRVELLNSTYVDGLYNVSVLRIAKFNRTVYVMNFEFEIFVDFDQHHELEVSFHYNRLNNNQYTKSLLRVPRSSFCGLFVKYYSVVVTNEMKSHTNFPSIQPNRKWCPVKKVNRMESKTLNRKKKRFSCV